MPQQADLEVLGGGGGGEQRDDGDRLERIAPLWIL